MGTKIMVTKGKPFLSKKRKKEKKKRERFS